MLGIGRCTSRSLALTPEGKKPNTFNCAYRGIGVSLLAEWNLLNFIKAQVLFWQFRVQLLHITHWLLGKIYNNSKYDSTDNSWEGI